MLAAQVHRRGMYTSDGKVRRFPAAGLVFRGGVEAPDRGPGLRLPGGPNAEKASKGAQTRSLHSSDAFPKCFPPKGSTFQNRTPEGDWPGLPAEAFGPARHPEGIKARWRDPKTATNRTGTSGHDIFVAPKSSDTVTPPGEWLAQGRSPASWSRFPAPAPGQRALRLIQDRQQVGSGLREGVSRARGKRRLSDISWGLKC